MTEWTAPVDAYCERTDASFWSEPLNAASNAAFILAAISAALLLSRQGRRDPAAVLLIALVVTIGLGSFLFHTVATRWAALADIAPIAAFIHVYLFVALRRFLGWSVRLSVAGVLGFVVLSRGVEAALGAALAGASAAVLGSIGYAPAALALFTVGALALRRRLDGKPSAARPGRELIMIGCLFCASLAARSIDLSVCARLSSGTHWLWHVLNAGVLYALTRSAILVGPPARSPTGALPPRHGPSFARSRP